jgi:hypothetical protein
MNLLLAYSSATLVGRFRRTLRELLPQATVDETLVRSAHALAATRRSAFDAAIVVLGHAPLDSEQAELDALGRYADAPLVLIVGRRSAGYREAAWALGPAACLSPADTSRQAFSAAVTAALRSAGGGVLAAADDPYRSVEVLAARDGAVVFRLADAVAARPLVTKRYPRPPGADVGAALARAQGALAAWRGLGAGVAEVIDVRAVDEGLLVVVESLVGPAGDDAALRRAPRAARLRWFARLVATLGVLHARRRAHGAVLLRHAMFRGPDEPVWLEPHALRAAGLWEPAPQDGADALAADRASLADAFVDFCLDDAADAAGWARPVLDALVPVGRGATGEPLEEIAEWLARLAATA